MKITARRWLWLLIPISIVLFIMVFSGAILKSLGALIVVDENPPRADVVVVLNTGVEYYPRLIQAADIYRSGLVDYVVINGNRKTDTLREFEANGFKRCCPWYADSLKILNMFGVPDDKIFPFSVEDAYDTVSEAEAVGRELIERQWTTVVVTTSKYHTRRAKYIWQKMYAGRLEIVMVSAKTDPYDPNAWWRDGRQIRWLLAEYGAWVFYWWKNLTGI